MRPAAAATHVGTAGGAGPMGTAGGAGPMGTAGTAGLAGSFTGGALIDAVTGARLNGPSLTAAVAAVTAALDPVPFGPVLCLTGRDLGSVVRYLGVLAAGRPAIVWDPAAPPRELEHLVATFGPAAVLGADFPPPAGYAALDPATPAPGWVRRAPVEVPPHPRLALLLATSGSTGRPRLVRQSAGAVAASARAIVAALDVRPGDVAVTTLPLCYTLGLSVLHSHLLAGATVVLEGRSPLTPEFWHAVDRFGVTTVTGVPHTYELLARKRWRPGRTPAVRVLTVSGGRLRDDLVTRFHAAMAERGGAFFVMYGQTEAGSRICVLPPDALPAKLGSVGPPVPGVRLSIEPPDGGAGTESADGTGEVVCHSPAVMMGYADRAEDLARGDDARGTLRTGDRGRLDADGYLWLSGRLNRIGKAFGVRVDLDAVEHVAAALAPVAAIARDDRIAVWCEGIGPERRRDLAALVARELRIHPAALSITAVDRLPRRPNGKIDYCGLTAEEAVS